MAKIKWEKILTWSAKIILLLGGINWLFTVFSANLVEMIFQSGTFMTNAVYFLIGLSTLVVAVQLIRKKIKIV